MPTPHLAGTAALAATGSATTVTITSGTTAGNAIIVCTSLGLTATVTVTGVTDTKGNSYTRATSATATEAWVALNTAALTTTDTVTVTWSTSGSWAKNVIVADCPGIATILALDPSTANAGPVTSSTAVTVTSGVPAVTSELAFFVINNGNAGTTPGTLGSFTSLSTIHNGSTQFLTAAYLTAGAGAVTATATLSSATTWVALLILLSPTPVTGGPTGVLIGATVEAGSYGGSIDADISTWINSVINPARNLSSIRVFYGPGNIPASMAAGGLSRHAGVRRVLMSFKPALVGSGNEAADKAALNTFLADCSAADLDAKVALYHEPDSSAGLTASQYKTMVQYYSATVRTYYPLVYCKAAYRTHVDPGSPGNYYPGDAYVDECAYDFYEYDWRLYGQTLDSMAAIADGAGKPFSAWELGVVVGGVGGTTAGSPGKATQAQGTAYMQYVTNYFKTRQAASKPIGDISYYDYVNASANWDHVIQPGTYLAPLYDALYDALSGGGATAPGQLAAELDISLNITESLITTVVTPPDSGGQAPFLPGWPQLILEAAVLAAAPVATLGTFILDDPVNGKLDAGRFGNTNAYTDVSAFLRAISVARTSSRQQGPLLTYQPGTMATTFDNADGRFDPDNTGSPYAAATFTGIHAMVPVRLRALLGASEYQLYNGFADGWEPQPLDYEGGYAEIGMSATDGFKILQGQNLPAVATSQGDSELSGARVNRILNSAGWYTDHRRAAGGDSPMQGTLLGDSPLNLLQLTADSEIGELYIDGAGNVVFRNRHAILSETRSTVPQALFGDLPNAVTQIPAADADFETALTGNWIIWVNITSMTQSVTQANTGTHSLAVAITGAGTTQWIYNPHVAAVPGTPHTYTFAVFAPATDAAFHVTYFWFTASGSANGNTSNTLPVTVAAGWQTITDHPVPPAGTASVQIWHTYTAAGASTLFWDTISWQQQTELAYAACGRASDDATLANDVQITRAGGIMQRSTSPTSIAKYLFPRTYSRDDVLLTSDAEAKSYAQWVRYVSSQGENRFETLVIDPLADPAGLFPQVLGREIGDRITVWNRPASVATPVVKDCFIRGIQHDIDAVAMTWQTTWTLQDATRYANFFVLDSPTLGLLDSQVLAY